MKKSKKNIYLDTLIKLILFSAIFHIFLLIIYSIIKLNITYLNYFKILDIDLFFPNIVTGSLSQIISISIIIIMYVVIYFISSKKITIS